MRSSCVFGWEVDYCANSSMPAPSPGLPLASTQHHGIMGNGGKPSLVVLISSSLSVAILIANRS